jgi:hypothetical protein
LPCAEGLPRGALTENYVGRHEQKAAENQLVCLPAFERSDGRRRAKTSKMTRGGANLFARSPSASAGVWNDVAQGVRIEMPKSGRQQALLNL